jgi:uncharacterized protein YndB with AHSA1/START domain
MSPVPRRRAGAEKIQLERRFPCRIGEMWELWTTKEGLESWWGPEGFVTEVRRLDVRPGGEFEYCMTVVDPDLRKGMEAAGMPLSSVTHGTYTDVVPMRRLAYTNVVDFIPDTELYGMGVTVEFEAVASEVRIRLVSDRLHNRLWTERATLGYTSQFEHLRELLARRAGGPNSSSSPRRPPRGNPSAKV